MYLYTCSIVNMFTVCCMSVGSLWELFFWWHVCGSLHHMPQGRHHEAQTL